MNLEDQIVGLELSVRLKKLNVKQQSYFYWLNYGLPECKLFHAESDTCNQHNAPSDITWLEINKKNDKAWSAFTVAELGEMMDSNFASGKDFYGKYFCRYVHEYGKDDIISFDDNEANCRAKMLIHLIEQGIHKP